MSNRIRTNFEYGVITDNPLTSGATTSNSTQYVNLPVVTSPNYLAITLDPRSVIGAPEIVYVTAHAANSSSITITRGQEGTTARQHSQNESWVHAPTAYDFANTALPTTSNVTDSASIGNGPAFALADHLHGREGFASSIPSSLGPSAGTSGSSPNPSHHDHVHAASTVVPTTSLASDTPNAGSNSVAAGDHIHGREGYGTSVSVSSASDLVNPGIQTSVSRSDHQHGREGYGTSASSSAVGDLEAAGTASSLSRSDHRHGRESFGNPGQSQYGDVTSQGVSSLVPRSDHQHARPAPRSVIGYMDNTSPTYGNSVTFATVSGFGVPRTPALTPTSSGCLLFEVGLSGWVAGGAATTEIADVYLGVGWSTNGALAGPWGGSSIGAIGTPSSSNYVNVWAGILDGSGGSGNVKTLRGSLIVTNFSPSAALYFYLLWSTAPSSYTFSVPAGSRLAALNGTFIRVTTIP